MKSTNFTDFFAPNLKMGPGIKKAALTEWKGQFYETSHNLMKDHFVETLPVTKKINHHNSILSQNSLPNKEHRLWGFLFGSALVITVGSLIYINYLKSKNNKKTNKST